MGCAAWLPAIVERGRLDGRAAQEELRRAIAARAPTAPPAVTQAPPVASNRRVAQLLPAERLLLGQLMTGNAEAAGALTGLEDSEIEGLRSAPILRAALEALAQEAKSHEDQPE